MNTSKITTEALKEPEEKEKVSKLVVVPKEFNFPRGWKNFTF